MRQAIRVSDLQVMRDSRQAIAFRAGSKDGLLCTFSACCLAVSRGFVREGREIRLRTDLAKYCNSQIYFLSAFLVVSVFDGSDFGLSSFFFADESPFADEPDDASAEDPADFLA